MPAAIIFASLVASSFSLSDAPGLRYEVPQEHGPIVRDLRFYPPNQIEFHNRREPLSWLTDPEITQTLDPSQGQSTMRWTQPVASSLGSVRVLVWSENGYEWMDIDPIVKMIRSSDGSSSLPSTQIEIDLAQVPGHLNSESFVITIDWIPVPTGGLWRDSEITMTYVRIAESPLGGDFDRDGVLAIADLNAFAEAFMIEAPRCDLNRDGVIDGKDLAIFLAAFEANFRP